jgi:hypothetical protein
VFGNTQELESVYGRVYKHKEVNILMRYRGKADNCPIIEKAKQTGDGGHASSPNTWKTKAGGLCIQRQPVSKHQNPSRMLVPMPVILAIWETEILKIKV